MGPLYLRVGDLARSLAFYEVRLGMERLSEVDGVLMLGAADRPLVGLIELAGADPAPRGTSGLYHYALLLPTRAALGHALEGLLTALYPLQGAADHLVSEAVYLADPDGNGVEIYADRPRQAWPRVDDQIQMATDPLDVDSVLAAAAGGTGPLIGPSAIVGHVHLHVGDLAAAEAFYGQLGFSLMARYGQQAAFYSAGGYHHHLGLNTWAGEGAPPAPRDRAGLERFEIWLPDEAALAAAAGRLEVDIEDGRAEADDPAGNRVVLRVGTG
jgi:catechol 2,3-dioxygenase